LTALKGRTVQQWSAHYPAVPPPAPAGYSAAKSRMQGNAFAGVTSVTFSGVKVVNVDHAGSAVEVTLQYGDVQKNMAGMTDSGGPDRPIKFPPGKPPVTGIGVGGPMIKSVVRLQ
jgi:hypothetical protein